MSPKQQKGQSVEEVIKADPRVRRTRERLQQALDELLKEKDFPEINVRDVANQAEVNRGTFYKHFLDKDDLLDTTIRERFRTRVEGKLSEESILSTANLNLLIQIVWDCLRELRGDCQYFRPHNEYNRIMQQTQQQVYNLVLRWLQNGPIRLTADGQSAEGTALAISWMICGSIMQLAWESSERSEQGQIGTLSALVNAALADYLT